LFGSFKSHWDSKSLHICCSAKPAMLPCNKDCCIWHLVYVNSPPSERPNAQLMEKLHVQDRRPSPRPARLAVRPPAGRSRPRADDQRPRRQPQWRPALFRPLIARSGNCDGSIGLGVEATSRLMAPDLPEPFFYALLTGLDSPCNRGGSRTVRHSGALLPNCLSAGIRHTRIVPAPVTKQDAHWEDI